MKDCLRLSGPQNSAFKPWVEGGRAKSGGVLLKKMEPNGRGSYFKKCVDCLTFEFVKENQLSSLSFCISDDYSSVRSLNQVDLRFTSKNILLRFEKLAQLRIEFSLL
jgi:hypothetical protein